MSHSFRFIHQITNMTTNNNSYKIFHGGEELKRTASFRTGRIIIKIDNQYLYLVFGVEPSNNKDSPSQKMMKGQTV